jgi:hypothetical protein
MADQRFRGTDWFIAILALMLVLTGCQSTYLAAEEGTARWVAVRRGQFEISCPDATGTVLSSNQLQPELYGGDERAEYTIGVAGCGRRAVYINVCAGDDSRSYNRYERCYAARPSGSAVISRFQGG